MESTNVLLNIGSAQNVVQYKVYKSVTLIRRTICTPGIPQQGEQEDRTNWSHDGGGSAGRINLT